MKGKIKKFLSFRGYGFIESEKGEKDIFFHNSNYPEHYVPEIGQYVEFTVKDTPKGIEAYEISIIENAEKTVKEND
jgi:cold shock CspA family protein